VGVVVKSARGKKYSKGLLLTWPVIFLGKIFLGIIGPGFF